MKKLLLVMLLFLTQQSFVFANNISIISSENDDSDVVEVLIRGNGGYCSL